MQLYLDSFIPNPSFKTVFFFKPWECFRNWAIFFQTNFQTEIVYLESVEFGLEIVILMHNKSLDSTRMWNWWRKKITIAEILWKYMKN